MVVSYSRVRVADVALLALVILILGVDATHTIAYWSLETNPLTIALGPIGQALVKTVVLSLGFIVWFQFDARESIVARLAVNTLTVFYAAFLTWNLLAIL